MVPTIPGLAIWMRLEAWQDSRRMRSSLKWSLTRYNKRWRRVWLLMKPLQVITILPLRPLPIITLPTMGITFLILTTLSSMTISSITITILTTITPITKMGVD